MMLSHVTYMRPSDRVEPYATRVVPAFRHSYTRKASVYTSFDKRIEKYTALPLRWTIPTWMRLLGGVLPSLYLDRAAIWKLTFWSVRPSKRISVSTLGQSQLPSTMKRKKSPVKGNSPAKKAKPDVPDYHLTPTVKEEDGSIQWPAPKEQIEGARRMIIVW